MSHSRLQHLRALLIPLSATLFFVVHPHSSWLLLAFAISPFFPRFPGDTEIVKTSTRGSLELLPYALFGLQCVNLPLAASMIHAEGWWSLHTVATLSLTCVSSTLCGAVVGHELIHRPRALPLALGRFLLATVLNEHFFAEHLRGHHARYATAADPATARYGETFWQYLRRSPPAQLKSAWRLSRVQVLQGLVLEAALVVAFGLAFGATGVVFFLLQALAVHVVFNAVQYFEHWGLDREVTDVHAWDAEDRATLFGIVGLGRHADHHARPAKPFGALESRAGAPKLPRSYAGMIWLVIARNSEFQRLMRGELEWMREPDCS